MSRALLRCLCACIALLGLLLPSRPDWRRPSWMTYGTVFLALGGLSAASSSHRFQALREWEMWLLAALVGYTVAAHWRPDWNRLCLLLAYVLSLLTVSSALLSLLGGSSGRVGGFFHHPNALSTLCLMLLPVTMWRALSARTDAVFAQALSGALLGVAVSTGSLTGGALLAAAGGFWACPGRSWAVRIGVGFIAACGLVAINLWGGWWTVPALTLWLVLCGALFVARQTHPVPSVFFVAGLVAVLMMGLHAACIPTQTLAYGYSSRSSSGLGRLEFYRTTLAMVSERPGLGLGPAGFSRYYPARQTELAYFSKFPHSLPLEIVSEWGVPAAMALALLLFGAARSARRSHAGEVAGWVVLAFILHSSTDVQTQFPFLLVLCAVALGLTAAETGSVDTEPERSESTITRVARVFLAAGCLLLLVLNLARVVAGFERHLALKISRYAQTPQRLWTVDQLLSRSFSADPLDSESARLWGLALLSSGKAKLASEAAAMAVELDPGRASCELLRLTATPPPGAEAIASYQRALELDRVNYPIFYWKLAEELWLDGRPEEARVLLEQQATVYDAERLQELFYFREDDLSDQLVEFFALKALLEEWARPGAGEPDFRLALQHAAGRAHRLQRLFVYLQDSPVLGRSRESHRFSESLQLFREQIPTGQSPGPVRRAPGQP